MEWERLGAWAGVVVPVWTLGSILVATVLSPSFAWTGNALSSLGAETAVSTTATIAAFNGGLITGGVVGLSFAAGLHSAGQNRIERAGAVIVGLALLSMAGVGVFPQDRSLHFPMAVGFYLLFTVALCVHGVGSRRAGDRRRGAVSILLSLVHLSVWIGWAVTGPPLRPGLAVPEFAGAVLVAAWTGWQGIELLERKA